MLSLVFAGVIAVASATMNPMNCNYLHLDAVTIAMGGCYESASNSFSLSCIGGNSTHYTTNTYSTLDCAGNFTQSVTAVNVTTETLSCGAGDCFVNVRECSSNNTIDGKFSSYPLNTCFKHWSGMYYKSLGCVNDTSELTMYNDANCSFSNNTASLSVGNCAGFNPNVAIVGTCQVPTLAPVTSGPATSGPATSAPGTSGPATSAPATSSPVTSAPVTSSPVTSAPTNASAAPTATPTQTPTTGPTADLFHSCMRSACAAEIIACEADSTCLTKMGGNQDLHTECNSGFCGGNPSGRLYGCIKSAGNNCGANFNEIRPQSMRCFESSCKPTIVTCAASSSCADTVTQWISNSFLLGGPCERLGPNSQCDHDFAVMYLCGVDSGCFADSQLPAPASPSSATGVSFIFSVIFAVSFALLQ